MTNGLEQTGNLQSTGFTPAPSPESGKPRSNIVLYLVLGILVVALITVGFLLLRKRGILDSDQGGQKTESGIVKPPPGTRTLESYTPERPYREGDPIPSDDPDSGGFDEEAEGEV